MSSADHRASQRRLSGCSASLNVVRSSPFNQSRKARTDCQDYRRATGVIQAERGILQVATALRSLINAGVGDIRDFLGSSDNPAGIAGQRQGSPAVASIWPKRPQATLSPLHAEAADELGDIAVAFCGLHEASSHGNAASFARGTPTACCTAMKRPGRRPARATSPIAISFGRNPASTSSFSSRKSLRLASSPEMRCSAHGGCSGRARGP